MPLDCLSKSQLAKAMPAGLAWLTDPTWICAPHLSALNLKLMAVARGEIKRLMVFMPPRHGKSTLISECFPAWYLGNFPDRRVILSSYEADFAATWGRKARNILEEYGKDLFDVELAKDSTAANRWDIAGRKGGMITAGVGGAITGKGAHVYVIDDPIKGPEQAHSKTIRDHQDDHYKSVVRTRIEPEGSIIIVLTRWNEDDLAGRRLKDMTEGGEQWDVLSCPAIAKENDPLGRQPGEPLFPQRYPLEELANIRMSIGSYWWSALYDQDPKPDEGNIFKRAWWKYYKRGEVDLASFSRIIQSWDMTFKDTASSCYVSGQVWGEKGADKYLIDQTRGKFDFVATIDAFQVLTSRWPQSSAKLVEDKANGPAVIATLKHKISGIIPITPHGSKEARAHAITPYIEAGNIYLPEDAPWISDFVEECSAFPNAAYNDQVDSMTQALDYLTRHGELKVVWL